ncbi:tetratricopeptide repeat protein 19 homolog, mitochondrial [Phlebotomus argentipes]|uniref:tetratricopeptide repeat protein 19 homolog, mitochondrial n=1 Tax=Phlebotomus argentipes TaxID=94469 RepID=UPI002892EFD2|nr:tetratricopeptide repeat protein 19 homolog, mitochondrial [Phlebotomus argentipes]
MQVNAMKFIARCIHRIRCTSENIFPLSAQTVRWNCPVKSEVIPVLGQTQHQTSHGPGVVLGSFYFWNIFKKKDDKEETPEDKLIMTIKRSILSIQRGEYNKAEQMLHLALRMAQELQHKDGITYIYDVMANLALEKGDFEKAEKLFVNVMQRLFGEGFKESHIKMLHISSKIAHMAGLQGNFEKAKQGFEWTLQKLEEKLKIREIEEELKDVRELWGMTKNWYGQTLLELNKVEEAKQCFLAAWEVFNEFHDQLNEDALMLLNNLGVVCMRLGETSAAEDYLRKAITVSKEIPDFVEVNVFRANLGLVYLQQGLLQRATDICSLSWRLSKKAENDRALEQAEYCLDQIKKLTSSSKG